MTSAAPPLPAIRDIVPSRRLTLALAAALAAAGVIHCLLTPEHMAMSAVFGAGFLAAGMAQLGMAGLALIRPTRLLYAAVIASTVVLSTTYAYNVLVGLPFQEEARAATGIGAAHSEGDAHGEEHAAESDHADEVAGHDDAAQTDHHDGGLALGGGEPVEAYGAATQAAQLTAAAVALALLRRKPRKLAGSSAARFHGSRGAA